MFLLLSTRAAATLLPVAKGLTGNALTHKSMCYPFSPPVIQPVSSNPKLQAQTEESISTCRFAQRVSTIKNDAKINEDVDPEIMIRRLRSDCAALTDEVAFLKVRYGAFLEDCVRSVCVRLPSALPTVRAILTYKAHFFG